MQYTRGPLNRPLRHIIQSIGRSDGFSPTCRRQHIATDVADSRRDIRHVLRRVHARAFAASAAPAARETGDDNNAEADTADAEDEEGPTPRLKHDAEYGRRYFKEQLHRQHLKQQKVATGLARLKQRTPDTWRHIIRLLDQATPDSQDQYKRIRETVTLPSGVAAVLVPSKEAAILEIMQRTGCHIQMVAGYAVHGSSNAFTGIALQGTRAQNSAALSLLPQFCEVSSIENAESRSRLQAHELRRQVDANPTVLHEPPQFWQVDETARGNTDTDQAPSPSAGVIRATWTMDRRRRELQPRQLVRDASALRTPIDFGAYIDDLTWTRPTSRVTSRHQQGQEVVPERPLDSITTELISLMTHPKTAHLATTESSRHQQGQEVVPERPLDSITTELISLLTHPKTAHLATTESIGRTFHFLVKHSNLAAARHILEVSDQEGRNVGPIAYNALLAAAVDAGDVHNIEYVLKSMLRRGESPDAVTWATVHGYINRFVPSEVDTVVQLMRSKGLLANNAALRLIVMNTIRQVYTAYIQKENTSAGFVAAFDEQMRSDYGRPDFNWLSVDVLTRMLRVLVILGRMEEAVQLLHYYREKGHGPVEVGALNTMLSSTSHDHDMGAAIATLKLFRIGFSGAVMPDRITYHILFMTAWRCKYYNVLKVVWRYACVAAGVCSDMRYRVGQSLVADVPAQIESRSAMFRALAGKFAMGVTRDLIPRSSLPYREPGERQLTPTELRLVEFSAPEPSKQGTSESQKRRATLTRLLRNDLDEAGNCRPILPLTAVLERAWTRDVRWQRRGLGAPGRHAGGDMFREMLQRGVTVPMRPGDFTKQRKWEVPALLRRAPTK